jgi:hypothetical protein
MGTVTRTLHIAHKQWAYPPRNFGYYRSNLLTIKRWADGVRCVSDPGAVDLDGKPIDFANGRPPLVFPWLDQVTSNASGAYLEQNYLTLERWANTLCSSLHIPHKEWLRIHPLHEHGAKWEQANLLAIQRWSEGIGRCCTEPFEDTCQFFALLRRAREQAIAKGTTTPGVPFTPGVPLDPEIPVTAL